MRCDQPGRNAGLFDDLVPAIDAGDRIADVVVAQHFIERIEHRNVALDELAVAYTEHGIAAAMQAVIIVALGLFIAAFEARVVEDRGIARLIGTKQIDGHAKMKIEIALQGRQVDHAGGANPGRIVGLELVHDFAGAGDDPRDARLANEHVMRFFGQHEFRGAGERIETAFGQRAQLELAVAIGEVGEHEKSEPVGGLLVESAQDARIVFVARTALEQGLGLFAAVAPEVLVQQIDHRPQMAAFLDIDLEKIAQVVLAGRSEAEMTLLLDRGRLGVALRHDDAAQIGAVLAGHVLPGGLALVLAEVDRAAFLALVHEDAPAIVGHLDMTEVGPSLRIDAHRGAQIDVVIIRALRAHVLPPVDVVGLPVFERSLKRLVLREVDVVGDLVGVIDGGHVETPEGLICGA